MRKRSAACREMYAECLTWNPKKCGSSSENVNPIQTVSIHGAAGRWKSNPVNGALESIRSNWQAQRMILNFIPDDPI